MEGGGQLSHPRGDLVGRPVTTRQLDHIGQLRQCPQHGHKVIGRGEVGVEGGLGRDALGVLVGIDLAHVLAAREMVEPAAHRAVAAHEVFARGGFGRGAAAHRGDKFVDAGADFAPPGEVDFALVAEMRATFDGDGVADFTVITNVLVGESDFVL